MNETPPRLFLERDSYRRRRWIDAARLLPFAGLFLWLVPLVWPSATSLPDQVAAIEGAGPGLAQASIYLFVVWFLLILAGAVVSRKVDFGVEAERESAAASTSTTAVSHRAAAQRQAHTSEAG